MRIAIMAPLVTAIREPQLGGSQAFVSDLARGLVGRGHDVHVYAASGSEIPGVEVIDTGVDPRLVSIGPHGQGLLVVGRLVRRRDEHPDHQLPRWDGWVVAVLEQRGPLHRAREEPLLHLMVDDSLELLFLRPFHSASRFGVTVSTAPTGRGFR
jgi:hypothetical protein